MDDGMLDTQCRDVARCIKGLTLTLLEARDGNTPTKIITEVHKLIQSFRLLGNHYVSELLKMCRELEKHRREVKELSGKLERSGCRSDPARVEKLDVVDAQQHKHRREVMELSGQLERGGCRSETVGAEKPHVVDAQQHLKTTTPVDSVKDVEEHDQGKLPGCNKENVDFLRGFDGLGAIERGDFIDLGSDSEEGKNSSTSTSWPQSRMSKERQGTLQEIVAQEQNKVETLSKAMEHYQHEFLENFLGSSAYSHVARFSTLD